MANPPRNTYISIPPPPLPEFYTPKKERADVAANSSGTEEIEATTSFKASNRFSEYVKQRASPGDGTDERHRYAKRREASDVSSSLAVYHVCRICLRPRSARYHREHPIPVDGLPPPPGICRRCRVTSVEDSTSMADAIEERHESRGPKIGVKCLVVDEDYLPAHEARSRRVNYDRAEIKCRELEPPPVKQSLPKQTKYGYRHIHVAVPPPPIHPPPPPAAPAPAAAPGPPPAEPIYTYVPRPTVKSTAQDAIDSLSEKSVHSTKKTQYEIHRVRERIPTESAITAKSDLRHAEGKKVATTAQVEVRSSSARSTPPKPEWTESDIRRLARDEVERYRQAERKIEAHGDAYAHGRMVPVERTPVVPVERRIELQREVEQDMPWRKADDQDEARTARGFTRREYRVRSESQSGQEEVFVLRRSRMQPEPLVEDHFASRPEKRHYQPPTSISSESSSDKTRWPSQPAREARTSGTAQQPRTDTRRQDVGMDYTRASALSKHHDHRIALAYERRDSGVAGLAQNASQQKAQPSVELPYPRDDTTTPVPMPSPSSHASRPAKKAPPRDNDSEYYYKLRTVQPADEAAYAKSERDGTYYKETSEYLHRRKPADKSEAPAIGGKRTGERRQSDVSSRVRFANKVAVSPTPPGSDASSARFITQGQADIQGPDRIVDFGCEQRGRHSSRVPQREHTPTYGQDPNYFSQQHYQEQAGGGTVRSALRGRRPSRETDTATAPSTLPIDVRMLAQARSESPSREKLLAEARRRRQEGFGPYTVEHDRSVSLEAYDGSSVGSDREVRKHQKRRERREQAGRQDER